MNCSLAGVVLNNEFFGMDAVRDAPVSKELSSCPVPLGI